MERKKIVLLIVEGPSDDTALGACMGQVFDSDSLLVLVTHGDLSTRKGIKPENIVSRVGDEVKNYAALNHYKKSDFREVIHIVDTDGAYIPDTAIIYDPTAKDPLYLDDGIHTDKVSNIIERNRRKRENLSRLRERKYIWVNIPYKIFYMSCNLDHVLYDKRNSSDEEKEDDSYIFVDTFLDNQAGFISFICNSAFAVKGDYRASWDYIEHDMRSIKRHSNLALCIEPM